MAKYTQINKLNSSIWNQASKTRDANFQYCFSHMSTYYILSLTNAILQISSSNSLEAEKFPTSSTILLWPLRPNVEIQICHPTSRIEMQIGSWERRERNGIKKWNFIENFEWYTQATVILYIYKTIVTFVFKIIEKCMTIFSRRKCMTNKSRDFLLFFHLQLHL